jgi:hypothetical protein
MTKPLFADGWYEDRVRTNELRIEIQRIHELLMTITERLDDLEERVSELEGA